MTRKPGLWIDHKNAFIAFAGDQTEYAAQAVTLSHGVEKRARFSGSHSSEDGSADD
jgi:hypothetical protein